MPRVCLQPDLLVRGPLGERRIPLGGGLGPMIFASGSQIGEVVE
jgi:hypothetical protein